MMMTRDLYDVNKTCQRNNAVSILSLVDVVENRSLDYHSTFYTSDRYCSTCVF